MFKNLICTIAIAMSLIPGARETTAATKVFLIGGQSNAAGVGGISSDSPIPAPYNVPQPAVKFWNYNPLPTNPPFPGYNDPGVGDGWVALQSGFGYTNTEFGPEVSFGYRIHQMFPHDDIYLIKYGISSQDLAVHWNPDGTGNIYNMFQARVHAAMQNLTSAGLSPTLAGMIWMQGDMDANNSYSATAAASYATNLTHLIQKTRTDTAFITPNPNMQFVVGRILNYYDTTPPGGNALVRNAQMTVPGQVGNASWFNTDDLELAYPAHYGTQGQIDLGIRFANEFAHTPEPSTLVLAGTGFLALAGHVWRRRKKELRNH